MLKKMWSSPLLRVLGQVVGRVMVVFLLRPIRYPLAAVAGFVVIELLHVNGILYLCQVDSRVNAGGISLLLHYTVATVPG